MGISSIWIRISSAIAFELFFDTSAPGLLSGEQLVLEWLCLLVQADFFSHRW